MKIPLEKFAIYCQLVDPSSSLNSQNISDSAAAALLNKRLVMAMAFFIVVIMAKVASEK